MLSEPPNGEEYGVQIHIQRPFTTRATSSDAQQALNDSPGSEDSALTRRAPFEPLWRPLVNAVRKNQAGSMVGLIVGALPAFGFLSYYLKHERGLSDSVFEQIRWLFWLGLPAEILLQWTHVYEVPLGATYLSTEDTVKRWVVYVVINILLCMLLAVGFAELLRVLRRRVRRRHRQ